MDSSAYTKQTREMISFIPKGSLEDHASPPKKADRTTGWEPTTDSNDTNANLHTENRKLPILGDRDKPVARVVCQQPTNKKRENDQLPSVEPIAEDHASLLKKPRHTAGPEPLMQLLPVSEGAEPHRPHPKR